MRNYSYNTNGYCKHCGANTKNKVIVKPNFDYIAGKYKEVTTYCLHCKKLIENVIYYL